jgi:hypothetical protein
MAFSGKNFLLKTIKELLQNLEVILVRGLGDTETRNCLPTVELHSHQHNDQQHQAMPCDLGTSKDQKRSVLSFETSLGMLLASFCYARMPP